MSFEATKARLIDEFVETQAAIRAEFNMKVPEDAPEEAPAKATKSLRTSPVRSVS